MPLSTLQEASARRAAPVELDDSYIDRNLALLLSNYQKVTADPKKMGYLRFLIKHYAKDPHPWAACYKDNFKRFGPKTAALCGVLKDTIRQTTDWRGKNDPNHRDHGAPGVGIAEADKGAANPPWGPWMNTKLSDLSADQLAEANAINLEVLAVIADIANQCDPCRVLLGFDETPTPSKSYTEAIS
jgi:hypothetical protein